VTTLKKTEGKVTKIDPRETNFGVVVGKLMYWKKLPAQVIIEEESTEEGVSQTLAPLEVGMYVRFEYSEKTRKGYDKPLLNIEGDIVEVKPPKAPAASNTKPNGTTSADHRKENLKVMGECISDAYTIILACAPDEIQFPVPLSPTEIAVALFNKRARHKYYATDPEGSG